uniref:class I SAM-dependent methyltransferase n=1 Tax=Paractinoplanes polyasparticus TaxID=2856853 RepID=UPI001C855FDC|nr:class I SAM-dependent methyltransferase [Actinoplanes polyasparticus]
MNTENLMRLLSGLVEPLLSPLSSLPSGAHVVQIASGTGGLSRALARRRSDLKISAIDINPAVLNAGHTEADRNNLAVDFRKMDMTRLEFADDSADAVISRMGLLLAGTAPFAAAAQEAARILRPGGTMSIATWADLAGSPYTRIGLDVLSRFRTPEELAGFETAFARPQSLESYLIEAGLRDVEGTWYNWETEYPEFADWWSFVTGIGPLAPLFASLGEARLGEAQQVMTERLAGHRTATGGYRLPATARLITARG